MEAGCQARHVALHESQIHVHRVASQLSRQACMLAHKLQHLQQSGLSVLRCLARLRL